MGFDEAQEVGVLDRARGWAPTLSQREPDAHRDHDEREPQAFCEAAWRAGGRGTNIVSIDLEFRSVMYPWFRVAAETGADVRLVQATDVPAALSLDSIAAMVDARRRDLRESCAVRDRTSFLARRLPVCPCPQRHAGDRRDTMGGDGPDHVQANGVDMPVAGGYKWVGAMSGGHLLLGSNPPGTARPAVVGWRSTSSPMLWTPAAMPFAHSARRLEFSTMSYGAGVALGRCRRVHPQPRHRPHSRPRSRVGNASSGQVGQIGTMMLTPRDIHSRAGIVTARFPGRDGEEVAARLGRTRRDGFSPFRVGPLLDPRL